MPLTTLAGHPAHPVIIVFPAALIPSAFLLDLLQLATRKESYAIASQYALTGAITGGLAAAATGALDYLSIPKDSVGKRMARFHGLMNLGVMGLAGLSLLLRKNEAREATWLPAALSGFATALVAVSAWYGGHLVYELGIRVEGRGKLTPAREIHLLPADEKLGHALARLPGRESRAGRG